MTRTKFQIESAFTLIELLVVISIIGILAAMVMVSFSSSQRQARDTTRKSDMNQYRTSLEEYANKNNGLYLTTNGSRKTPADFLCSPLGLGSTCPEDPENKANDNYYYSYITDNGGTEYVLWAQLENASTKTLWVVCSNGKSGTVGVTPSSGDCPL